MVVTSGVSLVKDGGFFQENPINLPKVLGIEGRGWVFLGIVRVCDSDFNSEFPSSD